MTVVGHIEQLRQSACYQKSDMTCLTCHDPHTGEKPRDSIAFYRGKCLSCHGEQGCKLDQALRRKKDPADNCAACHMPRGDTDIPHIAFTHHRIGRHSKHQPTESDAVPNLVPTEDDSGLSPLDRKRNLGLAYLDALRNPVHARYAAAFRERARTLLETVRAEGLSEGDVMAGLAQLCFTKDQELSGSYARSALRTKDLSSEGRALALIALAHYEASEHSFQSAIDSLEELVRLRNFAEDWRLLGKCYLDKGEPEKALPALKHALAIRPYRYTVHTDVAETYRRLGDTVRAREHEVKARWLRENNQY
jgi:tetratricopeptide (TPR) repeat protein